MRYGWRRPDTALANVVSIPYSFANCHSLLLTLCSHVEPFIAACIGPSMFEKADSAVQPKPAPEVTVTIILLTGILSIPVCKRSLRELLSPIEVLPPMNCRRIGSDSSAPIPQQKLSFCIKGVTSERIRAVRKRSSCEDSEIRFRKWSKNPDGNITRDVKLFCMLFKIVIVSCK